MESHGARFELSASVVLWRGEEILVMKRAGGFAAGGWFVPGGHLEGDERPAEACARELFEETGIAMDPAALHLIDVMSFPAGGPSFAHILIYNGECPAGAEPAINDEHFVARWMPPEAYIGRFLDSAVLRARGVSAEGVALAEEVARVIRVAQRCREGRNR